MAAVVASTLRRRTMQQQKQQTAAEAARYQASTDPEQVTLTRTPTKTASFYRGGSGGGGGGSGRSPQHSRSGGQGAPSRGVSVLLFADFWPRPTSVLEDGLNVRSVTFERFE